MLKKSRSQKKNNQGTPTMKSMKSSGNHAIIKENTPEKIHNIYINST